MNTTFTNLRRGLVLTVLLAAGSFSARAQTGGVRIGTAGTPDASAVLDVSTDPAKPQGLLLPRLTIAQRQAIASPAVGLLVYQTDGVQPGLWYNQASGGWTFLNSVGPTGAIGPQGPAATPTYVPDPAWSTVAVSTLTPSNSTFITSTTTIRGHTISIQTASFTAIAIYGNIVYLYGVVTGVDNNWTTSSIYPNNQFSKYDIYKINLTTMVFSQMYLGSPSNRTVPTTSGGTGEGLAVSDDGSTLYQLRGGNILYSFNTGSGAARQQASGFHNAQGITYYNGYVYVADTDNNCIRVVTPSSSGPDSGSGTLLAGSSTGVAGNTDGSDIQARFNAPSGIAIARPINGGASGRLFVTDTNNHRIRSINASTGTTSTLVGNTAGYQDGGVGNLSSPSAPQFNGPVGIAYSYSGPALYVTDINNNCVRKIDLYTPSNIPFKVSTVAGSGMVGLANGPGYKARFNGLTGIANVPNAGTILILDTGNNAIRQLY